MLRGARESGPCYPGRLLPRSAIRTFARRFCVATSDPAGVIDSAPASAAGRQERVSFSIPYTHQLG